MSQRTMKTSMKAWVIPKLGSIDLLEQSQMPYPTCGADEVILKVHFAALNPADRYLAEGAYPSRPAFPHILGRDGIGEVVEKGEMVTDWKIGDSAVIVRSELGVSRAGSFAEYVAVPAESLVKPPEGWTPQQSAAATLVYLTAWQALTQWGTIPPGNILVTGASGGVGVATIQLGKALGHKIIALSRGPSKIKKLMELGADLVLDPNDTQWRNKLKEQPGNTRIDLAVDNIGGELFTQVIDTLGMWGRISVVGRLGGPVPHFNPSSLFFRRLKIGGVAVASYSATESRQAWEQLLAHLYQTHAQPLVDSVFSWNELPAAFARLKHGPMGKVVLNIRE